MKLRILIICIGLTIINSSVLHCQDSTNVNHKLNVKYVKSYFSDEAKILLSPIRWDATQFKIAGAVLLGTALVYSQDKVIKDFFQRNKSNIADNISSVLEPFGSGEFSVPLLGVLFLTAEISKSKKLRQTTLEAGKAFVLSGFTSLLLKEILHRPRPFQYDQGDVQLFDGPLGQSNYNSMPSGHTITAFSIATVFATEYKNILWVPILSYTIATGVALSRIYDNKHWASDVVMGSALGWAIGKLISNNSKLKIYPLMNSRYTGMGIRVSL